tara:strand:+ start:131 stop:391 length:261 start_codon:yes stop_codon:yes gene_type:complete
MSSLLTQQLVNYDYQCHNRSNNYYKTSIQNIQKKPIHQISKKNTYNISNECSLNIHCFNPTKNSPPNEWQFRLIKRINSFNTLDNN